MAKFYDVATGAELARIEALLQHCGIEYTIGVRAEGEFIKEILVAEEDLPYAESLLSTPVEPGFRREDVTGIG